MKTPAYIQIVGFFNQNAVGLTSNDTGGELDPHGADLQGNPLGGLFYSTAFGAGGTEYVQTQEWNHFVGSGQFCLKLCDPTYNANGINYCQNIYDLIGCKYNMPADYAALESQELFVSCEGELQDVVGTYVENGATTTWRQPDPLTTAPPWEPRIPASSNCKTYKSTDLFPVASLGYQSTNTNPFHTSTSASASQATGSGASGASRTSHSGAVTGTPSGSSGSSNKSSPAIKTLPCVATVVLAVAAVFLA
jgi:hypothetical protein